MSFRDNLQHLRATKHMTQEQLAMLLGVSRQAVTKWEAEKSYPEMDKLLELCRIFDCSLDELVQGDLTSRESKSTSLPLAPTDICGYEQMSRNFAFLIPTGIAIIIFGVGFAASNILGGISPTIDDSGISAASFAALLLCILIGSGLIIHAGLTYNSFKKAHPYIEDFYAQEDHAQTRKVFVWQLMGGIAFIFIGILFIATRESLYTVFLFFLCTAIGVWLIVHTSMMINRLSIEKYNTSNESYEGYVKTASKKKVEALCGTIMLVATIIALIMLLGFQQRQTFYLCWVVGGIACGIVSTLAQGFIEK